MSLNRVLLKFCGLFRPEDIEAANLCKPDYIGFILAKKGHRQISAQKAEELKSLLDPSIKAVGVFIDEDPDVIAGLFSKKTIDAIQLHGKEDDIYIERLRSKTGAQAPIIKAFGIDSPDDIKKAARSAADLILLDYKEAGSGESFDWSVLKDLERPFILAGGISTDNLDEALSLYPVMIDISSGIETNKQKDFHKMREVAERLRRFNDDQS